MIVNLIGNMRDHLTHFEIQEHEQNRNYVELYETRQIMEEMLSTCLLLEIDFNSEKTKELMQRFRKYRYVVS